MEIVGFKSFADRTKIEFDQGITAVVGPNGSGKSNIVESLRWVLGEQSAKSLRGGKMPDVIFAGTEKRRALNYAEVIAHFDNRDQYLRGYDEEDEVIVTRRLYRNGDSEFLINGKKCRLRDIHDLFTDTGLGRDSLSIISQGRIESVFNSKPEERRAIFEEAAGVLKYKNRRGETETKLSATQDNIDRLEDIIFELNGQLVPLQAQRDTALRFQELDLSRSQLALSVLVGQLSAEKKAYDETQEQLTELSARLTALTERREVYEKEVSLLKERRNKVEDEQENCHKEQLSLSALKADLLRKIELFDVQKNSSEKTASERKERLRQLTEKLSMVQENLKELEDKKIQLEKQKINLEQTLVKVTADLADLEEAPETVIERLRDEFVRLVSQEAEQSNTIVKNKSEIDRLVRKQSEEDKSTRENRAKYETICADLSVAQEEQTALKVEIKELLTTYESLTKLSKTQEDELRLAQNKMYDELQALNQYQAKHTSLQNIRESHSNLFAGVRAVMQNQARIGGVIGVVSDLLSFDRKYTTAIDIALGGGSQNIITEDENSAKRAIAYLREKRLGRATFLPLTTIKAREFNAYSRLSGMTGFIDTAIHLVNFEPKLHHAISSLLGTTVIVDTAENATQIARSMNYTVRIVTLDGTQINPGGSYAGGAGKRNATTFTNVEIESLKEQLKTAEADLKKAEKDVQNVQKARELTLEKISMVKEKGEEKRFEEKGLLLKIEQLSKQKEDLALLTDLSVGQDASETLRLLNQENNQINLELTSIAQRKTEIEANIDAVKSNSQAHKTLKEEKTNSQSETRLQLSEVSSELKFIKNDENRLLTDLSALTREKEQLEQQLTPVQFDEEERKNFAIQLEQTKHKLEEYEVQMVSLKFEREDLLAQTEELEQHHQAFITESQTLGNQKTRAEMRCEQAQARLFELQETLNTDYQMSFEEAQKTAAPLTDLSAGEQDLKQLERKIRALGPINLDAITQFEEVNERFLFLTQQKEDLLEAKTLLISTIDEMNDEVKVRFKSTFDAIQESFKLTFAQMFEGGMADLELTSDNLLSAGVEIKVQPPGKKLASLNLMSGGEKALTALALIFAILRVRTVPFVVLDEVEAALDEANVKRFGDYMNHFDNSNQFIVVTHRRGTMAAAGAMYGITMADAGVSKVISVKLEK